MTKKIIYILTVILAVGFLLHQFKGDISPGFSERRLPTCDNHIAIGENEVCVEIADEYDEQRQGLSDREYLCPDCGMLFVFKTQQVQRFWMKNMHFPLDIIWIDYDETVGVGKIVNISENLPPEGESPDNTYSSVHPINYVLEVGAGFADAHGIDVGDVVRAYIK